MFGVRRPNFGNYFSGVRCSTRLFGQVFFSAVRCSTTIFYKSTNFDCVFFNYTNCNFCLCCPAGGVDLETSLIFLYLINVVQVPKHLYLVGSRSALERLVLENDAECTSQHLKWTSGARVMMIFLSQDMSRDHKTCLVITRHVS